MQHRNLAPYAIGAAALALVLYALGVKPGAVLVPLALLACPLMMFFMMRGMGGSGNGSHTDHDATPDDH